MSWCMDKAWKSAHDVATSSCSCLSELQELWSSGCGLQACAACALPQCVFAYEPLSRSSCNTHKQTLLSTSYAALSTCRNLHKSFQLLLSLLHCLSTRSSVCNSKTTLLFAFASLSLVINKQNPQDVIMLKLQAVHGLGSSSTVCRGASTVAPSTCSRYDQILGVCGA